MKKGTTGTNYGVRVEHPKQRICVTIDKHVLDALKQAHTDVNKPFSTLVNELLTSAVKRLKTSLKTA